MKPIRGRPLLGHVIDRARLIEGIDGIVVATSDRDVDDPIAEFAEGENVDVFRGSAADVAGRCLDCMEAFAFQRFVRITGDSPFFDPALAGRLLRLHKELGVEVATNVSPRTFPRGASVEVVSREAMRRVVASTEDADDREHVTRCIYAHPDRFDLFNLSAPDDRYDGVHLTVDTPEDLRMAEWIAEHLPEPVSAAPLDAVVATARQWRAAETGRSCLR